MSRSNPQQFRREAISDRNFVLPFGKYKGESIADLIEMQPQYLLWLTTNTDFELDHKLQDEVEEQATGMMRT